MRRFSGSILFVLFSIALFALGEAIGTNYQPANAPAEQHPTKNAKTEDPWLTKDAAGFFTFLLVIIGGLQLALFGWQLWLIGKSLREAKTAANAAHDAAKAAQESANIGRDTLITTDRAFVFLNDIIPDYMVRPRGTSAEFGFLFLKPHWCNNGNTPTRNMRIQVDWAESPTDELPADFAYPYRNAAATMFLAPKAAEWSHAITIPTPIATNALHERCHIFVYGRADYDDVFADTEAHFTQWCYRLVFLNAARIISEPLRTQPVAFGPYNGADENKSAQRA